MRRQTCTSTMRAPYSYVMKHLHISIVALLLAAFTCTAALAQKPAQMTDRGVARFVNDWPSVSQWLKAKGKQFDADTAYEDAAPMELYVL